MKIFAPIVVLLFSFNCVLGCSYIGYPDPPLSYIVSKIKTIYIGKVISKSTSYEKNAEGFLFRVERIRLKVEKAVKSVDHEFQEITIAERVGSRDSCYVEKPNLRVGESWIIHTNFDAGNVPRRNITELFLEMYVKFNEKYHLEYLEKVKRIIQNPVTAIYGHVQTHPAYPSIGEIKVFLEGNGLQLSTRTNKSGEYSFEKIPAGFYKIQIRFPSQTFDMFNNQNAVFNELTKTYNLEYSAELKTGESYYYYISNNGRK